MSLHRCRFRPWRPYGAIVPYGRKPARETRCVNLGAIPAAIVGANHRPSLLLRPRVHGTHAVPRRGQLVPPPEARRRGRVTPPIDARAGLPHVARCGLREARWALRGPSPRPASAPSRRPCRRRRRRAVLSAAARASKTAHLRGAGRGSVVGERRLRLAMRAGPDKVPLALHDDPLHRMCASARALRGSSTCVGPPSTPRPFPYGAVASTRCFMLRGR